MSDEIIFVVEDEATYQGENGEFVPDRPGYSRIYRFRVWLGDRIPWERLAEKVYPANYGRVTIN